MVTLAMWRARACAPKERAREQVCGVRVSKTKRRPAADEAALSKRRSCNVIAHSLCNREAHVIGYASGTATLVESSKSGVPFVS